MEYKKCMHCGEKSKALFLYCSYCGTPFGDTDIECVNCGAMIPVYSKFCGMCGSECGKTEKPAVAGSAVDIDEELLTFYELTDEELEELSASVAENHDENTSDADDFELKKEGKEVILVEYKGNDSEVVIPNGVTSIGNVAFGGCDSLENILIPNSVTSIGICAFWGCDSLKSILIPNSVIRIDRGAFCFCVNLTIECHPGSYAEIYAIDNNIKYKLIESEMCESVSGKVNSPDFMLENKDNEVILVKYIGKGGDPIIPDDITVIRDHAFEGCTQIRSVVIPKGVKSIGAYAFRGCTSLKSVSLPDTVRYIGTSAFYNCPSLVSITIPENTAVIDDFAFGYLEGRSLVRNFRINCRRGSAAQRYADRNKMLCSYTGYTRR